ncbi:DUF1330 domain-containing protein [Leisingera aquaemixtae]|uniref:Uncharacterized protein n=1 Tax=Leisingera aquaemixtae TaxID=1396826 RepID=A0A0P1HPV6_9RHOB|nr:DUF1330 domain-containing protein [Leisingera aquaemixtae]CUH99636.1 hypothetical protein PHA8399_01758 [Leisingera aquaemixtae]
MTMTQLSLIDRIESILANWGAEGSGQPGEDAWKALAKCPNNQPVTLVNFFKMRDSALYPKDFAAAQSNISGQEAFQRYAAVSMPSLEKVGGKFLLVAPFGKTFIGTAEEWDLVAIGSYPNPSALLSLFELEAYREAYIHRIAACSDQKVSLCLG